MVTSYGISRLTGKEKHLMLSIFMFPRKDGELLPKTEIHFPWEEKGVL